MSTQTKKYPYPRRRVQFSCGDELITKQSHKEECDITTILAQFKKTGIINHISKAKADYMNLPSQLDYQLALNTVIEAEQAFSELPSKIRDRYANNPAMLLAAIGNPENRAELTALGILKEPPAAPPEKPASPAPSKEGA